MIEFEIVARGAYRPDQLAINYDPSLRMPTTPEIQTWMDTLWQEKLAIAQESGIRLFDAPLFRFIDATSYPDEPLSLVMGDTSYKEYVTTRTPTFAHGRTRHELGCALSVCSVVETSDDYILLDKRQGVETYVGRYHVIGGFFERNLDMATHTAKPDPFAAICREIYEEVGIQQTDISTQYCLGVVYDMTMPHGEMCFLTQLTISLDEVLHHRTPQDDEIKELQTLRMTAQSLRDFLVTNHGNISPTGEPNLLFYGSWKFGERWFEDVMKCIDGM